MLSLITLFLRSASVLEMLIMVRDSTLHVVRCEA